MKQTKIIMGMPITVEIIGEDNKKVYSKIFKYFESVDRKFSTYKSDSEVSKINRKEIYGTQMSDEMKKVIALAEKTKKESDGFFNVYHKGIFDPSGVVKGWSMQIAADILLQMGYKNFYINAGGDIQVSGKNSKGKSWKVGIRNPFNRFENVKVVSIKNGAVATSGTYIRGEHIYNPYGKTSDNIVSVSVIGKNIADADRYATAAFAMGNDGIYFIERLKGFEGYIIDRNGVATMTSGFGKYLE